MVEQRENRPAGRFICAWCGKDLGPSGTPEDSAGICPKCLREFEEKARRGMAEQIPRQKR